MARSSIFLTTELVDESSAIVAGGGLSHVKRHDDGAIGIGVEHVLDDRVVLLGLVADAGCDIRQNISHIITAPAVFVVAELPPDKDRLDLILEGQAVGQLAMDERAGRQGTVPRALDAS